MELDVTVQIEGADVLAGHLYQTVRHGIETASFSYAGFAFPMLVFCVLAGEVF